MDGGQQIWVPDIEHGFRLGTIIDLGADEITIELDGLKGKVGLYLMNKLPQKLPKPRPKSLKPIFWSVFIQFLDCHRSIQPCIPGREG